MSVAVPTDGDQRSRIQAAALELMARDGSAAVSMRQLAKACGLNVATLYHYFGSKAELLGSVIADRNYEALLDVGLPIDASLPPRERLARLLDDIWSGALAEADVWRLVIGESLHSSDAAVEVVADLVAALKRSLARWLSESFTELGGRDVDAVAVVIANQVFGGFIETLVIARPDAAEYLHERAVELAALIFPNH